MSANARLSTRDVVTPVTIAAFVVSTVTGVMLLLHWNAGLVRFSHEWLSVVFSAVAIWHLARNWRSFTAYLRRNAALVVFVISLAASVVFTGLTGTSSNANPGAVFRALSNATLDSAAPAFGMTSSDAIAILKSANIEASGSETLNEIGTRTGVGPAAIATIFATKGRR
jgi:Domain of unknown function (DUF4405)